MKILFAALYDPRDLHRGSGTSSFLCRELERQGHTVSTLTPPAIHRPLLTRLFVRISRAQSLKYRAHQDPWTGRRRARALGQQLRRNKEIGDIFLTNDASLAAFTPTDLPKVLYTDAIFPPSYDENVHPWLDGLSPLSVRFCQYVNRLAIRRSRQVLVASEWAANLVQAYDHLREKPEVLPFGANLDIWPEMPGRKLNIERVDLLFVGKDWALKGGDLAIRIVELLRRGGISATLHVVGASIPKPIDRTWIVDHGSLDKAKPRERVQLEELYRNCSVFLLPSLAEGFGIAYAEAAAFGLPSLAFRTTGVETAVADGQSGLLLPLGSPAVAFANAITSWLHNPDAYMRFCKGARRHFAETVNWKTTSQRLSQILEDLL